MNTISYHFKLADGRTYTFVVDIDRSGAVSATTQESLPFWTKLSYQKCSDCPLTSDNHPHCPAAVDIQGVVETFSDILSIDRVDMTVETAQRSYQKNCDMQDAIRSLLGLILATSRCPSLSRLKPLAHYHLPFATMEETIHRVVGTYLLKQRLLCLENRGQPDWQLDGLTEMYQELEAVNAQLMLRLREASRKDANLNAIYIFVALTSVVNLGIDNMLERTNAIVSDGF